MHFKLCCLKWLDFGTKLCDSIWMQFHLSAYWINADGASWSIFMYITQFLLLLWFRYFLASLTETCFWRCTSPHLPHLIFRHFHWIRSLRLKHRIARHYGYFINKNCVIEFFPAYSYPFASFDLFCLFSFFLSLLNVHLLEIEMRADLSSKKIYKIIQF